MNSKEQILQMVKEGTITVEDGIKLLEALGAQSAQTQSVQPVINVNPAGGRKMLRVTVDSAKGDVVRINVPTSLVKAGLNLVQSVENRW
jgi:flagellar basal body rod protein FlgG